MRTNEVFNCSHTKLVELKALKPNPKNPNKHPKDQIQRLAKIIEYQGQRAPIVVSNRSGFITKGHGRLEALKALNWDHAAVDYQDYEDEAQEYADIVADNAISEWARMDLSDINAMVLDFGPDFNVEMFGMKNFTIELPSEKDNKPKKTSERCEKVSFVLSSEQKDLLEEALTKAKFEEDCSDEINKDEKGNALTALIKRYIYG